MPQIHEGCFEYRSRWLLLLLNSLQFMTEKPSLFLSFLFTSSPLRGCVIWFSKVPLKRHWYKERLNLASTLTTHLSLLMRHFPRHSVVTFRPEIKTSCTLLTLERLRDRDYFLSGLSGRRAEVIFPQSKSVNITVESYPGFSK